jgi:tetratricopeptide (TPR) repeat protein
VSNAQALELNPNYSKAWNSQGTALWSLGRNEEALASYDKALEIEPDYYQAWSNRGNALQGLGRNEEALASCDKALEIKPDFGKAKSLRSRILTALDSLDTNHKTLLSLFNTIDPNNWLPQIRPLLETFNTYYQLPLLAAALVKTTHELNTDLVSLAKATAWRDAWAEAAGTKPEMQLPLRLLSTAIEYKKAPDDPRVFLALPTEERKILRQALGLEELLNS